MKKDLLRRLLYKEYFHIMYYTDNLGYREYCNSNPDVPTNYDVLLAYKTGSQLGLSQLDVYNMAKDIHVKRIKDYEIYTSKPLGEGRDNKSVHVGTGGSNKNPIRYPSKKRNKRTWRNFYKLFPYLAIKDNYDGQKSDKM